MKGISPDSVPHDTPAEEALIGSIFIDNSSLFDVMSLISPEMFYSGAHRLIYESMLELARADSPIDVITVSNNLKSRGVLEDAGGQAGLVYYLGIVPSSVQVMQYAGIVKEKAIRRRVISAAGIAASSAFNESIGIDEVYGAASAMLTGIDAGENAMLSGYDVASQMIDDVNDPEYEPVRLYSGLKSVDKLTGGFRPGRFIIVAARPGLGKTAFLDQVALRVGSEGGVVASFCLEMTPAERMRRMVSCDTGVPLTSIRDNELTDMARGRILESLGKISGYKIYFSKSWDSTVDKLMAECAKIKMRYGLDLVTVDYLQLMDDSGRFDNNNLRVASISRKLKLMAERLGVPVISASQLNRGSQNRSDKTPTLADLRDSGAIEQDADMVIFIHRENLYDNQDMNEAKMIIAKHREGETGVVDVRWIGYMVRFTEVTKFQKDS